ncbi:hypothetical protein ACRRTK_021682 [Alexandromys fortis]
MGRQGHFGGVPSQSLETALKRDTKQLRREPAIEPDLRVWICQYLHLAALEETGDPPPPHTPTVPGLGQRNPGQGGLNRAPKFSPATVTLNSPLQDERKLMHVGEGHRGRGAGARQAAAARTCSRSPEQLRAAVREARTQSTTGAEGRGPRLGLAPPALVVAHLPEPRTPSPEPPAPAVSGEGERAEGPERPSKLIASLLLRLPPQLHSASPGQEGPCPPRPLPLRLHKVAGRRPPTRPEGRGPRGSPADEPHRSGHALGTQGCTGCGWVAVQCTLSCSSVPPSTHPTCLRHPQDGKCGAGVPQFPVHPLPPSPAHLALKVNLSAAGALWFRQLVSSSGARPPIFARRPLSGSSGYAPPARPAPSALPAAVGAVAALCVAPAAAASAVT